MSLTNERTNNSRGQLDGLITFAARTLPAKTSGYSRVSTSSSSGPLLVKTPRGPAVWPTSATTSSARLNALHHAMSRSSSDPE
jgi:hypothetical protein